MAFEHIGPIVGRVMEQIATGRRAPVVLTLPQPPSANVYYRRHGLVVHRSKAAADYVKMVAVSAHGIRQNGEPAFPSEDVIITVTWHRSERRGDLPNRTKILYDALEGIMYADDKQIAEEHTRRVDAHDVIPKGCIRVEVSAVS